MGLLKALFGLIILSLSLSYSNKAHSTTLLTPPIYPSSIIKLDYAGFTVWLDCNRRGAVLFDYMAMHDTGSAQRDANFYLDQKVPSRCQQYSNKSYGQGYDRGHLVPANHFDSSIEAIKATNTMTNIIPQKEQSNRGAWLRTEEIVECYRDLPGQTYVMGGVIWGNNPKDDFFVSSHGVKTPDSMWKVVVTVNGSTYKAIAWVVPNTSEAILKNLDRYLVSVKYIETIATVKIAIPETLKVSAQAKSWSLPSNCKLN